MAVRIERRITSPYVQAILDYWHRLRGDRPAPEATEVDPIAIPRGALPYVLLVDLEPDPFRLRYRLVGSHSVDLFGDYRGQYLDQLGLPDGVDAALTADYKQAAETLKPVMASYPWPAHYGRAAVVNYALMPLLRDKAVIRFLAAEHVANLHPRERLNADDLILPPPPPAKR